MQTENQTISSAPTPMTNSFLSSNAKYGGLIKKKATKRLRNYLFLLIGYIDTISPHFLSMHAVITIFRIFQLVAPAFFASSMRFWPEGSLQQKIISYFSILFHIVPVEYRKEASIYIELIYFFVVLVFFIVLLTSAFVYKTSSKLPKQVVSFISAMERSVMFLIHPIALEMASEEMSRLVMGIDTYTSKPLAIFGVAVTYLMCILYCYTYAKTMSVTLLFRPVSLLATSNVPGLYLIFLTYLSTVTSGVATYLPKVPYVILTVITAVLLFLISVIPFLPASFVRTLDMKLVFSSSVTGGVLSIFVAIYAIIDQKASMIVLFVGFSLFVVSMIATFPVIEMYERKCLQTLDEIADDQNVAEHFSKPSQLIRYACIGYKYAHPVCLDWSIFKTSSEIWEKSSDIWATFGKFVAIYPEENNLLSYIVRNIETKKLKGNFAKQTIAQGRNILTQRETSLSSELKRKMQHVGKAVHHSKRKLRHIWDIVIQGNTHEMETAINNAYKTINKTEAEFNHVLCQYPNNRFIARSYARFLQEIKADFKGFQEWVEKVKLLQRGLTATVDNTNVLGIEAFPNLPRVLGVKNDGVAMAATGETESAFQLEVDIAEDEQVNEQMAGIRDQISSLKIPSLRFISIFSVVNFVIFILVPIIAVYFVAKMYIHSLNEPLEYMYYLSYLRTLANQLPAFTFRYIFENYPEDKPLFETIDYSDIKLDSFGDNYNIKSQYNYLIKRMTTNLEAIGQFRSYKVDDPYISRALNQTYKSVIPYLFYNNNGSSSYIKVSIQSSLMDYTIQLSKLNSLKIEPDLLNGPTVMNPLTNTETISNSCSLSIEYIIQYLKSVENDIRKMMLIILIVVIVFFAIYYSLITYIEISKVKANKHEIYSCFTSLPKNIVSGLAEALRILKKDSEGTRTTEVDTEYNKQEDNILKIFATAGDDTSVSSDRHVFIICNILFLIIDAVLTFMLTEMFKKVTNNLVKNGPHLNYAFGSTAYMMEAMNVINVAAASITPYFNYTAKTVKQLLMKLKQTNVYFAYYYQHLRYGGNTSYDIPFSRFNSVIQKAKEEYSCPNESIIPNTNKEIYMCFNADQQTTLFVGLVSHLTLPTIFEDAFLNSTDPLYVDLWFISAILLYQSFFNPMFGVILPQLKKTIDDAIPDTFPICIVLAVIAFILVIVINIFVSMEKTKLKFALSLLLHVQSSVIMQTQKIVDVLNGLFTSRSKDSTTRNSRFFTEVVGNLPDSIIIINNQMEIISANKSTERIYNVNASDLIGTKINDFLSSSQFSEDMTHLITNAAPVTAAVNPTNIEYTKEAGSSNHLEMYCITFNQFFVITTRDVTRMFVYNTLIEEERAKSDKLLASILPPSMVVRVQKGEKNISFAVQSATILFLDIVSFTPWCASNTAAMVMQTLNNMFKKLDLKLATHETATKIKCIGDCYMCAGGIFDEVNQPNVHAKEITEFGMESIGCVRQLDEENNLELQIRVGINTGGPIVAGVLGTEKPTFEILGPAINMAQQMEHHGVPMQVHISRSVYELIYGGSFVIKERGQIEIKSGKVITYLVQDKNAPQ